MDMSQENIKGPVFLSYGYVTDAMVGTLETKKVRKFARKGWNGKRMYVQIHGATRLHDVNFADSDEAAYIEPFFIIVNEETKKINTWVGSVSDSQAKDWYEVF